MSAFQSSSSSILPLFASPYEPDSEPETNPVRPPSSLVRVFPKNRAKYDFYILPSDDQESIFTAWWETSRWARHHPATTINWYKHKKLSKVWEYFRQIARGKDGKPEVQCVRCEYVLGHPSTGAQGTGTSSLRRHIQTQACVRESKKSGHKDVAAFFLQVRVRKSQLIIMITTKLKPQPRVRRINSWSIKSPPSTKRPSTNSHFA